MSNSVSHLPFYQGNVDSELDLITNSSPVIITLQASHGGRFQRLKAFYWSRGNDGGDSSLDEGPQVPSGDIFNQLPNLFIGDGGFYFVELNNITGRQETVSHQDLVRPHCSCHLFCPPLKGH